MKLELAVLIPPRVAFVMSDIPTDIRRSLIMSIFLFEMCLLLSTSLPQRSELARVRLLFCFRPWIWPGIQSLL
jgi:hypothetical protein